MNTFVSVDVVLIKNTLRKELLIENLHINYSVLMFTVFFLFSISITFLTLLALKNKGPNQAEIKIALSFMSANLRSLTINIKTLLSLLIKDILHNPSKNNLSKIDAIILNEKESLSNQISSNDYLEESHIKDISNEIEYSTNEPAITEDPVISEFSEELIQLIEEEEEKAA